MKVDLSEIIELAEEFECCPYCGRTDIESHFCKHCKKRISTVYDAVWFANYLKQKYNYN